MRFKDTKELLRTNRVNPLLQLTLAKMTCLITIAEADDSESLELVDMMNGLKVTEKYLILVLSSLNTTTFQNMTINYNVIVNHKDEGT